MVANQIFVIHPYDKTTTSLKEISDFLHEKLGDVVDYYEISANDYSHRDCLEKLESKDENNLIIFMGHGRSDSLYGARGDNFEAADFISIEAIDENPNLYYKNESFICSETTTIFNNKKVFCLSCRSNEHIATTAISNEAISFLGFGEIPSSFEEIQNVDKTILEDISEIVNKEIIYIIKKSLMFSIVNNYNFEQLCNLIKFVSQQRISDYLVNQKTNHNRYNIANILYNFKSNVKVFGDRKVNVL